MMYQYKADIVHVIDADTVDAEVRLGFGITVKLRLRVLDYDAPETYHPSCDAEKVHGKAATALAESLILNKKVVIHTHKKGKYGRYLANIFYDGCDFATNMKAAGMQKRVSYDQDSYE